jgi:Kef-type K+ transport system membrane component KefB
VNQELFLCFLLAFPPGRFIESHRRKFWKTSGLLLLPVINRMRTIAFALLTPFFFIKAGTLISLPALLTGLLVLLGVKMLAKFVGIWPLTRAFRMSKREGNYTTLLMSTGLTRRMPA